MAIGSIGRAQTVFNQTSPSPPATVDVAQSAAKEAQESPAVTQQEANKGDAVAKRKLAKEEASESNEERQTEARGAAPSAGQPAAEAEGKGQIVTAVA